MSLDDVPIDGGTLPVMDRGSGAPLVLLHGWSLDHRIWDFQIEDFSKDFRVLAPDRRGFGANRTRPDLSKEVSDLDALLDHYGYSSIYLLGMSQGGRIALRYAAARPSRVRALILHGAPLDGFQPPAHVEEAVPFSDYRRLAQSDQMDALRAAWRQHKLMDLPPGRTELEARITEILASYRGDDLRTPYATQAAPNLAARLFEIAVSTLIVIGAEDTRWLHLVAHALEYGLPHSRKETIKGGGHLVNMISPRAYNASVRNFLFAQSDRQGDLPYSLSQTVNQDDI